MFNVNKPWIIEQWSNGPNGPQKTVYQNRLMSGTDARLSAHRFNQFSPYGRTYVAYQWKARPATPEEIETLSAYQE